MSCNTRCSHPGANCSRSHRTCRTRRRNRWVQNGCQPHTDGAVARAKAAETAEAHRETVVQVELVERVAMEVPVAVVVRLAERAVGRVVEVAAEAAKGEGGGKRCQ